MPGARRRRRAGRRRAAPPPLDTYKNNSAVVQGTCAKNKDRAAQKPVLTCLSAQDSLYNFLDHYLCIAPWRHEVFFQKDDNGSRNRYRPDDLGEIAL